MRNSFYFAYIPHVDYILCRSVSAGSSNCSSGGFETIGGHGRGVIGFGKAIDALQSV